MKLKRPLTSSDVQLLIVGPIAAYFLLPYVFHLGVARYVEIRRLHTASTYRFPTHELAELDRLLQARFAVVPTNDFGMARIGPRHEIFKAITPAERKAIEVLRHQKTEVVFYVAGRNFLQNSALAGTFEPLLQGPVYMTQKPPLHVEATAASKDAARKNLYNSQPI